MRVRHTGSQRV